MKKRINRISSIALASILLAPIAPAQVQKSVCQILSDPVIGEIYMTAGIVTRTEGNEDVWLTDGGCTIRCEIDTYRRPVLGDRVAVVGDLEVDDGDLKLDVGQILINGSKGPELPPTPVTSVAAAKGAQVGTSVEISGRVTQWKTTDVGEGIFADSGDSIQIDFPAGSKPQLDQSIDIKGVVDNEDGVQEIDVVTWKANGAPPPAPPKEIVSTAKDAEQAADGSFAWVAGAIIGWTNQPAGEGTFVDGSGAIPVDLEDGVALPKLGEKINILGIVKTEGGSKEIEGVAISEAEPPTAVSRLINLSTRGNIQTGSGILIGGFVVSGDKAITVLLRGIGPGLGAFGVPGTLGDPVLKLYKSENGTNTLVTTIDDWGQDGDAEIVSSAAVSVGAFALPANSKDASAVLLLDPGIYSAQVSGADGGTGVGLFEVYELTF